MTESHWGLESWPGTEERKQLIQLGIVRPGPGKRRGRGRWFSLQKEEELPAGPQAPRPGILHPHLLLLLDSCMPCELGESAPLPFGDHMPTQSSQGRSVLLPSSCARPVLLEGSVVVKVPAALTVRTRCLRVAALGAGFPAARKPSNSRLRAVGRGAGWVVLWCPCSDAYLGDRGHSHEGGIVHRVTLGLDGGQVHSSAQSPLSWVPPWGGGGRGCQEGLAAGHVQDHLPWPGLLGSPHTRPR